MAKKKEAFDGGDSIASIIMEPTTITEPSEPVKAEPKKKVSAKKKPTTPKKKEPVVPTPPPTPVREELIQVSTKMTRTMHKKMKEIAFNREIDIKDVFIEAISEYFEKYGYK